MQNHLLVSGACAGIASLVLLAPCCLGQSIVQVAQETAPGLGDFDQHVLGIIRAWRTSQTPGQVYGYTSSTRSWNGTLITPTDNRAHVFFAQTTEGTAVYMVEDSRTGSPVGGSARPAVTILPDSSQLGAFPWVTDDPFGQETCHCYWITLTPSTRTYYVFSHWGANETDGRAVARLPLNWTVRIQYTSALNPCEGNQCGNPGAVPAYTGLTQWVAYSSDGGTIPLLLVDSLRARFKPLLDVTVPSISNACYGATAALAVTASGGAPYTFLWLRNGSPANLSDPRIHATTSPNGVTNTLTISDFSPGDVGSYECAVTNAAGTVTSFAVTVAPCVANCDCSTASPVLAVNDFICFLNRYAAGHSLANCDGSTSPPILNIADFTCFINSYATGCS